MKGYFRLGVIFLLLTQCNSNRIYEDNVEFSNRNWSISKPVEFEFSIDDPSQKYNLLIDLRNSRDYPFSRLFINSSVFDSAKTELSSKLISEYLFDQKTGKPFGQSGLGDIYDHRFPLLNNYSFKRKGRYTVKLEQFMRKDTLQGVLAVGLRVETVGTK